MQIPTVDLSSSDLRPEAVVRLIRDHAANPGPSQILFKVSRAVHEEFRAHPKGQIAVSVEEADEINKFAGLALSPQDFRFNKKHQCKECGRTITFYDIFQSGRRLHGDDYVRRFIAGEGYHVQVHQKDHKTEVECTKCGTANRFDEGCYECGNYTYT